MNLFASALIFLLLESNLECLNIQRIEVLESDRDEKSIENEFPDTYMDAQDQITTFHEASAKLLMKDLSHFQLMTIADVLKELNDLRAEVILLNNIIEYDLQEMKQDLESFKLEVKQNRDIEDDIREIKEDLEEVKMDTVYNKGLISRNEHMMNNVSRVLQDEIDALILLPVGSIVGWSGKVISNADLPVGWQLCDGSVISDGPMVNQTTPALNLEARFLRGGAEFTNWSYQEQMLPLHQHEYSDPGHKHTDAGHDHLQGMQKRHEYAENEEYRDYLEVYGKGPWYDLIRTDRGQADIQVSMTGISIGDPVSALLPVGEELRPNNMAVQWIIKIYP